MNIVNKLTIRHLRLNRNRTLMTIFGITLSVAMVCAVAGFVISLRDLLMREIKERKGDYHVVFADVTEETAASIAGNELYSTHYVIDGDTAGLKNIYLRLKHPNRHILNAMGDAANGYGVESWGINNELLALEGVIAQDNVVLTFAIIAAVVIFIIVAGSVIVIANAFYISASERVRQFGLLKSAGATRGQIGRSILFEAFLLAAIAVPLGIALGFLIQGGVLWLTNILMDEISELNGGSFVFHVAYHPAVICVSVAIALLTVLVSAWLPARRAANTSPIDAIRQTKDIAVRGGSIKTSRLTRALFGFEGTLASKSLKRSRGKYRATVISLTVSIVLFVSMSSFVWLINKDAQMQYGGYDFDVLITCKGNLDVIDSSERIVRSIPDTQIKKIQYTLFEAVVPDGFTDNALENMTEENHYGMLIYPVSDDEFTNALPVTGDQIPGILVNTTGSFTRDGKLREHTPYDCSPGTVLPFGQWDENEESGVLGSVRISEIVTEIPGSIPAPLFAGASINILVPETAYREMLLTEDSITYYAVTVNNPDAFTETATELLAPIGDDARVWNISQMTRLNRNITLIVMLFGYGFIAMLSLIAVTSVITTISTGMALRRQEFAMLYSVGMTPGGMDKMLNLESLLYGIKSLVIGLPIGAALSYAMYLAMSNTVVFAYQPPYSSMLTGSAAVIALTFATMRYSKNKLKKVSIVEGIRGETV